MNEQDRNGWQEFKRLILFRLDEQGREMALVRAELTKVRVAVGGLKVRSSIWGGLAGFGAAMGALLYLALR